MRSSFTARRRAARRGIGVDGVDWSDVDRLESGDHLRLGSLEVAGRIDDAEAVRLARRELEVAGADALVEGERLDIEPVGGVGATPRLRRSAPPGVRCRQVEEQRDIGAAAAGGDGVDPVDGRLGDSPAVALIGAGRVGETVAEHVAAARQLGLDASRSGAGDGWRRPAGARPYRRSRPISGRGRLRGSPGRAACLPGSWVTRCGRFLAANQAAAARR